MTHQTRAELVRLLKDVNERTGTEVRLSPRGKEETRFVLTYCGDKAEAFLDGTGDSWRIEHIPSDDSLDFGVCGQQLLRRAVRVLDGTTTHRL